MLRFKFRHITPRQVNAGECSGEKCGTECIILGDDGTTLGVGNAYLHPTDNFSRPLGRKLSAGRAIRSGIERLGRRDYKGAENRRLVWEQLFLKSPDTFYAGRSQRSV